MEPVGYLFIERLSTSMRERTLGTTVGAERSRDSQGYHKAREHLTRVRQSITPMVSTRIARQCDPCPTSSRLVQASTRIRGRHTAFSPPARDGVTIDRSSPNPPAAIATSRPVAPVRTLAWPIRTARVSTGTRSPMSTPRGRPHCGKSHTSEARTDWRLLRPSAKPHQGRTMTREGSCSVRPEYALILEAATHDAGLAYLESIRRPESLALLGLRGSCTVGTMALLQR